MAARRGFLSRLLRRTLWTCTWLILCWVLCTSLLVCAMKWVNPPTTAFMIRAQVGAWLNEDAPPYRTRQLWRSLGDISAQLPIAVVAAEDQQFPFHAGFDFRSIQAALREREQSGRLRGASTISQQVAKNLFLWSGRSFMRKALEAYFTLLIEALWPKQRILEVYLNVAEFGRGIYGVEAAARQFFATSARRVTASQAALLAAVLPNPLRLRADAPSSYVKRRRNEIETQMRSLGGPAYLRQVLRPQAGPARSKRRP